MQPHRLYVTLLLFARIAYSNPAPKINQATTSQLFSRSSTDQNRREVSDFAPTSNDISSSKSVNNLTVPVRSVSCDSGTPEKLGVNPQALLPQCESALKSIVKYMPTQDDTPITLSSENRAPKPFGALPFYKIRWGNLVPGDKGMWEGCTVSVAFASPFQTGTETTTKKEIIEAANAVMTSCIEAFNQNGAYVIGESGLARVLVKTGLVGKVYSSSFGKEFDGGNSTESNLVQIN